MVILRCFPHDFMATWTSTWMLDKAVSATSFLRLLAIGVAAWIGAVLLQLVLRLWCFLTARTGLREAHARETEPAKTRGDSDKCDNSPCVAKIQEPCSTRCRVLRTRAHSWAPDMFPQPEAIAAPMQRYQARNTPLHSLWACDPRTCQACSSPPGPDCASSLPGLDPANVLPTSALSPRASAPASGAGKYSGDGSQSLTNVTTPIAPSNVPGAIAIKQHAIAYGTGVADLGSSGGSDVAGTSFALDTAYRPDNTSSAYDTARALVSHTWGQSYTPMFTLGRVALKIPDRHPSDLPPVSVWTRPYCEALEAEGIALIGAYVRQGCIHIVLDFLDLAVGGVGGGRGSGGLSGDGRGTGPDSGGSIGRTHSNTLSMRHGRYLLGPERGGERTCSSGGSSRSNSRCNSRRRSGRTVAAALGDTDGSAGNTTAAVDPSYQSSGRASAPGEFFLAAGATVAGRADPRPLPQRVQLTRRNPPTRVRSAGASAAPTVATRMAAAAAAVPSAGAGSIQYGAAHDAAADDDNDDDGSIGGAAAARNTLRPLSARRLRQLRRVSVPSLLSGTSGASGPSAAAPTPTHMAAAGSAAAGVAAAASDAGTTSRDGGSGLPPGVPCPAAASRLLASLTPDLLVDLLGPAINGSSQTVTVQLPLGGGDWSVQMLQVGGGGAAATAFVAPTPVVPQPPDLKCISPPCVLAGAQGPVMLYAAGTDIQGVASGHAAGGDGTAAATGGEAPLTVHVRYRGEFQPCRASLLGDQMPAEALSRVLPLDALRRAEVMCVQLLSSPPQPGLMFVECQRGGLLGAALPVLVAPNAGVWQEVAALQNAALQDGGPQMAASQRLVTDLGLWLDFIASGPPRPTQPSLLRAPQLLEPTSTATLPARPVQPPPHAIQPSRSAPTSGHSRQALPPLGLGGTADGFGGAGAGSSADVTAAAAAAAAAAGVSAEHVTTARAGGPEAEPQTNGDRGRMGPGGGFGLTRLLGRTFLTLLNESVNGEAETEPSQQLLEQQQQEVLEEQKHEADLQRQQQQQQQQFQQHIPGLSLLEQMLELAEQRQQQDQETMAQSGVACMVAAPLPPATRGEEQGIDDVGALAAAHVGMAYGSSPGPGCNGDAATSIPAEAIALGEYIRAISDPQSRRVEREMAGEGGDDTRMQAWGQLPPFPRQHPPAGVNIERGMAAAPSSALGPAVALPLLQPQQQQQQPNLEGGCPAGPVARAAVEWPSANGAWIGSASGTSGDLQSSSGTSRDSHASICGLPLAAAPAPPHADSLYNGRWQLPSPRAEKSSGSSLTHQSDTLVAPLQQVAAAVVPPPVSAHLPACDPPAEPPEVVGSDPAAPVSAHLPACDPAAEPPEVVGSDPAAPVSAHPPACDPAAEPPEVVGSDPAGISGDLLALGASEAATLSRALMAYGPLTLANLGAGAASGNLTLPPVRTDSSGTELHSWDSLTEAALAVSASLPPASSGALPTTPRSASTALASATPSPRPSMQLHVIGDGTRLLRPSAGTSTGSSGGGVAAAAAAASGLWCRRSEERDGRPPLRRSLKPINLGMDSSGQASPSCAAASAPAEAEVGRGAGGAWQRTEARSDMATNSPQPTTPVAITAALSCGLAAESSATAEQAAEAALLAPARVRDATVLRSAASQMAAVEPAVEVKGPTAAADDDDDALKAEPPPVGEPAGDDGARGLVTMTAGATCVVMSPARDVLGLQEAAAAVADGDAPGAATAAEAAAAPRAASEPTPADVTAAVLPQPPRLSAPAQQRAVAGAAAPAPAQHGCWIAAGDDSMALLHARMRHLGVGLLAFSVRRGWLATTAELLAGLARLGLGLAEADMAVAAREGGMGLLHLAVTAQQPALLCALVGMGQPSAAPAAGAAAAAGGRAGASPRTGICRCGGVCRLCSGLCGFCWDVAARGPMGLTPLHLATALDDGGQVAALLLDIFPDAPEAWFTVVDDSGSTPAEMASQARLGLLNEMARARRAERRQHQHQHQLLVQQQSQSQENLHMDVRQASLRQQQLQQLLQLRHELLAHAQQGQQQVLSQGSLVQDFHQQERQQQQQLPQRRTPTPTQTQAQLLQDVAQALQSHLRQQQLQQVQEMPPRPAGPQFVGAAGGAEDQVGLLGCVGEVPGDTSAAAAAAGAKDGLNQGNAHVGTLPATVDGGVDGPLSQQSVQMEMQQQQQLLQQRARRRRPGAAWLRISLSGFADPRVEARYRMYHATSLGVVDRTCGLVFMLMFLLPALELLRQRHLSELLSHCVFNTGLLGPYMLHAVAPALFRRHRDLVMLMGDVIKAGLVMLAVAGVVRLPRAWADFSRGHMDVIMLVIIKPLSEQIRVRPALLQRAAAVVSDTHIYAAVLYGGALLPSLVRALLQNTAALALLVLLDVRSRARFQAADADALCKSALRADAADALSSGAVGAGGGCGAALRGSGWLSGPDRKKMD